ncbi:AAA family ATPase [Paraburkholderia strydomiana]|uniref:AAA family ATPase n=1 Tax=Paraburkholderia strydomiana TaxID=1245417 RepID=UPI0038BB4B63
MIEKIAVGRHLIHLKKNQPEDKTWAAANLFSFDSFNLLIGANGAGKTSFLREVAWSFHTGYDKGSAEVAFSPSQQSSRKQMESYGVIYYTPIPYPVDLPRSIGNFINATPKYGNRKREPLVDLEHYQRVGESLGFNVRPLAVMSYDLVENLTRIGRTILEAIARARPNTHGGEPLPWLPDILHGATRYASSLLRYFTNASVAFFLGFDETLPGERRISDNIEVAGVEFIEVLLRFIELKLGDRKTPLLSALEDTIEHGKVVGDAVGIFMRRYLFDETFDPNSRPSSKRADQLREQLTETAKEKEKFFFAYNEWHDYSNGTRIGVSFEITDNRLLHKHSREPNSEVVQIVWDKFSSGQLALLYQFSAITRSANKLKNKGHEKLLILVDEGDIYLHAAWQRRYIELLDGAMKDLKKRFSRVQVILTSHSSALLTDVPKDCVTRIDSYGEESNKAVKSFAASLDDIVNNSFGAGSLGSFAQRKLKETAENLRKGKISDTDRYVIEMIDDPILKREFKRLASS